MENEKLIYEEPIMDITFFDRPIIVTISNGVQGSGDSESFEDMFGNDQSGLWP